MILDCKAPESAIEEHARALPMLTRSRLAAWRNQSPELQGLQLNILAKSLQAKPVADHIGLQGRINRMLSPQWWANNIRRELLREHEGKAFADGKIKKHGQCYVSDHAVKRTRAREARNREVLAHLAAVNAEGQAVGLLDCVDASVSNPAHRRTELMTRCRGFEDVAKFMGHAAVFLTITCPSKYHRFNRVGLNPKWDGSTPKDAQKYLCATWAKIRAEWKRQNIAPYGFRVAEPHHDGCPHWHILLFVPADQVGWFNATRFIADGDDYGAGLVGIAGAYALAEDKGEAGAAKARFEAKIIDGGDVRDASTGFQIETGVTSATGYIAKYISKNLDGHDASGERWGLDHDSGMYTDDASKRVRTWASVWGIRQFQQIGGPSVTVWRQLRSYKGEFPEQLELFRDCKTVAEEGKWAAFWMLQGGHDVPRSAYLRPLYCIESVGKYGEDVERVVGVQREQVEHLITRIVQWSIVPAGSAEHIAQGMRWEAAEQRNAGAAAVLKAIAKLEREQGNFSSSEGEAVAPWARVNNCTDESTEPDFWDREQTESEYENERYAGHDPTDQRERTLLLHA